MQVQVVVYIACVLYRAAARAPAAYACMPVVPRRAAQVRDFSFNPDNGAISRVWYDDFGMSFLPVNFFDCWSLPVETIESIGCVQRGAARRWHGVSTGYVACMGAPFNGATVQCRAGVDGRMTYATAE